jgi:RNA polymerase sigma-70 factor (ECF subfamily)
LAAVTSVGRASGLEPLGLAIDSHAEEALYRRNSARVLGFCVSRLRRREDAEDALQTTFLYAFRSLRRGVVPLVESAWLLGIARNVCLERWQAAGKRSRVETSCDPAELDRTAPALNERPDELIDLEDALTRLPAQQRRAVVLRDWRGLSYEEVADELGVSHSAVETLIFRGRRTLAEYLRDGAQATRRKLGSFANLGSLLSAAKTLFSGGAGATKIAAAVTVVAVSGAGVVVGESALRGGSEPSRPAEPERVQPPATQRPVTAAPPHANAPAQRTRPAAKPAAAVRRPATPRPVPAGTVPSSATGASAAIGQPPPAAESAAATPAPTPTSAMQPALPSAVKGPVAKTGETAKAVLPTVPLPPLLESTAAAAEDATASLPVAPVTGAVEEAAAPVVDPVVATVEDVADPVVAPVVTTAEDVAAGLPPVPPLLP